MAKSKVYFKSSQSESSVNSNSQSVSMATKDKILNEFLDFTLTKCMSTLNAKSGSIFLYDDKSEELVLKIARNGKKRPLEGIRQLLGEGISGSVASSREAVLVENINTDQRFPNHRQFDHYQTQSFLSVPLEFSGELIGVLNISERSSSDPFNQQDLRFLLDLCSFFSFSIYQFKRYKWNGNGQSKFTLPGRMAAGLIHELNNPLDGIIRYVNLSLNYSSEDGVVKEYLLEAKKGLNRIVKIVRSLLDLRRSASQTPGCVDINEIIDESLILMKHCFLSGKIRVKKELQKDLAKIKDYGLKLVINNILKNACDAIGSNDGVIEVITKKRNGVIDIKITDTGPGIPEDIQNQIFEPFFTTKEMGKGSGLGMAISLNIVERYKGCILLESSPTEGTAFTIRIPTNGVSGQIKFDTQRNNALTDAK